MDDDGIIAVGDICNTAMTAVYKNSGTIQWRNFIEVFSFTEAKAAEDFATYSIRFLKTFEQLALTGSPVLVPMPLTVSAKQVSG